MLVLQGWYGVHRALLDLTAINILLALALSVALSCKVLSLAGAGCTAIGAYTAAVLMGAAAWPLWAVLPAGALAASLVAILVVLPVSRRPPPYLLMATIAFAEAVSMAVHGLQQAAIVPAAAVLPAVIRWWQLLLALLAASYLLWHVERSRLGHAFAAIRQDELLAATMGIRVGVHKMIAFLLSAFLAGLAGGLAAALPPGLPASQLGLDRGVAILAYAVVGGNAFWGAWLSAPLLTLLTAAVSGLPAAVATPALATFDLPAILLCAVTLLVVRYVPGGVSGVLLGGWRRVRRGRPAPSGDDQPGHLARTEPATGEGPSC